MLSPDPANTSDSLAVPGGSDALDLRRQVLVLWRSRWVIVMSAVAFAVLGALIATMRPRQFEAAATIAVSAARLSEQSPGLVPVEAHIPLLTSPNVQAKVVDTVKLSSVATPGLLDDHVAVRAIPLSNLIRVVVRMDSATEAATVANVYAEQAVSATTRAVSIDVETVEAELSQMLDAANTRLKAAEQEYDAYRTSARFEMLEREVETLGDQRSELQRTIVELESERARLARLETDLAGVDRVTELKQAVVDDPTLSQAARAAAVPAGDLQRLAMTRQSPNPVFESLGEEAALTRGRVAFLEQQRQRLAAAAGLNGSQLTSLTQLYERESKLERLSSERELARKSYEAVAARYQGAKLAAVGRSSQLLVVDRAVAPDRPLGRYLTLQVVLGAVAGGLLACIVVLARQAFADVRGA